MRKRDPQFVGSVAKAFSVLELFDGRRDELGITEIARLLDMDKSGANRLVSTLARLGYLRRNPANRRYRLSHKVLEVAFGFLSADRLLKFAIPRLIRLSEDTDCSSGLCILEGTDILYLARQERHEFYYPNSLIGERQPAFCTSGGRAILCRLPEDEYRDILARSDRVKITPQTVTDLDELMNVIAQTRARGYSVQIGEYIPQEVNFACPVTDCAGAPIAAVLISRLCSASEDVEALEQALVPLLLRAAAEISSSIATGF